MSEEADLVVNARILYWGISGAGKTANLEHIHGKLRPDHRGDLERLATPEDPGICYEIMPIELGKISGIRTRLQIVAPPGAAGQRATRQQLLDQVDGIVFVLDSRRERLSDNLAALEELRSLLGLYGRSLEEVPVVLQYNRRDQSDDMAVEELHRKIGLHAAAFEAIAPRGVGVLESLTTISKRVVRNRREIAGLTQPPGNLSMPPAPGVSPLAEAAAGDTLGLDSTGPLEVEPAVLVGEVTDQALDAESTLPETEATSGEQTLPDEEHTLPEEQTAVDSMTQAVDVAAQRAERVFDANWDQATGGLEARTRDPGPLELQIISATQPVVESGRRLHLSLRLADQDGRQGDCVLTLDLSTLEDD